ncbi:NAD(P)/FAD-dependent oxidoreductase [Phaeobacter inhibens]|uniref:phytoene desaturase family protein n=1 Tax=Phaeobacter inhibens TaxID=221822 RepID=UPI0021A32DD8|nr:NAD(P)/FAD-dependent oxidoreductase [Phaeobacter inhibens]UWR67561.1 NAD(P)/FAD-dependent oxidoreductase [Phaeobacter inhibens]
MTDFDAIVIGAGNAGLSAAAGMQRKGLRTLLLERHNIPGGCGTSFVRGDFEFEVALHQLSGLGTEADPFVLRDTFRDLGVLDKVEFVEEGEVYRFCVPGEVDITLPADIPGLIHVLSKQFPQEADAIARFVQLCGTLCQEYYGVFPRVKRAGDPGALRKKCPNVVRYGVRSSQDVLDEFFSDPRLKATLGAYWPYLGLPLDELPFVELGPMFFLYAHYKPYHIRGGSQAMSNALLQSFLEAGGEVQFNTAAAKIHTDQGRVTGVTTEHRTRFNAASVVSNASSIHTFNELLDVETLEPQVRETFQHSRVGVSGFIVYLGLDVSPEELGITAASNFICSDLDDRAVFDTANNLDDPAGCLLTCYNYDDPTFAPEGKSVIGLMCAQYGKVWEDIPQEAYFETKYEFAQRLIRLAERVYPGIQAHIEEVEVATPLTVMRYLNTPGGAIYGFDQNALETPVFRQRLKGPEGLYLAGAWTGPGGFQPTYMSGHAAANTVVRHHRTNLAAE